MGEEGEPPDRDQRNSTLETKVYDPKRFFSRDRKYSIDKREIFLEKRSEEEVGILNMTFVENEGTPLLAYRVRKLKNGKETSDIEVNGKRILNKNDREDYDRISREDPRISIINGKPIISCIGYNGFNAISFAVTLNENYKGTRIGTTGPNIPLEEAIMLIPKKSPYRELLEIELENTKTIRDKIEGTEPILPFNKDTSIFKPKDYIEYLRIGNSIQKISVKKITDLQNPETWRSWFPEIDKHTILNPSDLQEWANSKIGQGSIPKKIIDHKGKERWINVIHGVEDKGNQKENEVIYRTTIAEYNPETWNMKSCMKYPFLEPFDTDLLIEEDPLGKIWKKSICFGNDIILPENARTKPPEGLERELMIIMGVADDKGGYYITNLEYVLDKLEESKNQIAA